MTPDDLRAPDAPATPRLLLVEPQFLVRRTVAGVLRQLHLAEPVEATSVEAATRLVLAGRFDGLCLSLDERDPALHLLARLRLGDTRCAASLPVVVTAGACDTDLAMRLKSLEVQRLLLRPFRVKDIIDAVGRLRPMPLQAA